MLLPACLAPSYNNGTTRLGMMASSGGLGSRYWGEVIEVLRSIIPVYDKVNRVISFGKDGEYRLR